MVLLNFYHGVSVNGHFLPTVTDVTEDHAADTINADLVAKLSYAVVGVDMTNIFDKKGHMYLQKKMYLLSSGERTSSFAARDEEANGLIALAKIDTETYTIALTGRKLRFGINIHWEFPRESPFYVVELNISFPRWETNLRSRQIVYLELVNVHKED